MAENKPSNDDDIFTLACDLFNMKLDEYKYKNLQIHHKDVSHKNKIIDNSSVAMDELSKRKFVLDNEINLKNSNDINKEPIKEQEKSKSSDFEIS